HRHGEEVVFGENAGGALGAFVGGDRRQVLVHHVGERGRGIGQQQRAQAHQADQDVGVVRRHHVDGEQRGGDLLQPADRRQGVPHVAIGGDAHKVAGHDAAHAVLVVFEVYLDVSRLLGLHAGQDLLGHLVVEVLQDVGRGGGGHLLQDVG